MAQERRKWQGLAATLGAVLALAACGGSGGDGGGEVAGAAPPVTSAPGSATVGGPAQTTALTIEGVGGAKVVVPAAAASAPVTVRIAADSSGSPALPATLRAAGAMYAVTPHGLRLDEPVEVHVPVPALTLAPNERLALAKADPGGDWTVLAEVEQVEGRLVGRVQSFSFFQPVVLSYVTSQSPLQVTGLLDCRGQPCSKVLGWEDVTYLFSTNGGVLPSACRPDAASLRVELETLAGSNSRLVETIPLAFNSPTQAISRRIVNNDAFFWGAVFNPILDCAAGNGYGRFVQRFPTALMRFGHVDRLAIDPAKIRTYPLRLNAADAVPGSWATVEAIVLGGAYGRGAFIQGRQPGFLVPYGAPTLNDRAVVEWERSDDDGASWRTVATSYQNEANGRPFDPQGAAIPAWRYWRVQHRYFVDPPGLSAVRWRIRACIEAEVSVSATESRLQTRCDTSEAATARIVQQAPPPRFTSTPRSQLVLTGQTASLSASATGAPTPTLQWQTRPANSTGAWTDVTTGSGATGANFTTPVLGLADNGTQYRVVATNAGGSEASPPVTVSVSDTPVAPQITANLSAVRTVRGGDATFAVAVRGSEPLSYEWRVGGQVVPGQNAAVLNLQSVQVGSTVQVSVINGAGTATSREVALTLVEGGASGTPAGIVRDLVDTVVVTGSTATLAVQAVGSGTLLYRWQRNGQDVAGAPDAPVYTLPQASTADAGSYRVIVSNELGQVDSRSATLVVQDSGALSDVLGITVQPVGLSVNPGQTATFAVAGRGIGRLRYQWLREGVPIAGATASVLVLQAASAQDAGNYTVQVMDATGTQISDAAGLVVLPAPGAPVFTGITFAVSAVVADSPRIAMAVSGVPAPRCLWLRNGVLIAGATDCSGYTVPNVTLADNGSVFTVVAYNAAGAEVAGPAVLTVEVPVAPSILAHPVSTGTTVGGTAFFDVNYAGTPAPERRWFINGVELAPAFNVPFTAGACSGGYQVTAGRLTLLNLVAACDGATVAFTATNSAGSATSNTATLSVAPPTVTASLLAGSPGVTGSADGTADLVRFSTPNYLTVALDGRIAIGDFGNSTIRIIAGTQVSTLAGMPGAVGFADGTGSAARFARNGGLAYNSAGHLFVADWDNHVIRRITPEGVVSTFAGSPGVPGSVDGTGSAARMSNPNGLVVDTSDNVYFVDWGNHTLRKITPAGVVSTFAGAAGQRGSADGTGSAARFNVPGGLAIDGAGNLYVSDMFNHAVRKITPAGEVSTLAGAPGLSGTADGTGSAARFEQPAWITATADGTLFVISAAGDTVRRVTPAGVVETVVGVLGDSAVLRLGDNPRLRNARGVWAVSANELLINADHALIRVRLP